MKNSDSINSDTYKNIKYVFNLLRLDNPQKSQS